MAETTTSPAPAPRQRTWCSRCGILLTVAIVGGVVWSGADRVPPDASAPLVVTDPPAGAANESTTLRLASFNIHGGKGHDGVVDLARIAELLDDVDLAGVYEVRAGGFPVPWNQARELAERHLRLASVFAATERRWWQDHFGNGVLARADLTGALRIPWPGTRGKAFRNAIFAEIPFRGRTVRVLATHIDRAADREPQLRRAITFFLALQPPAVLMGDLNTVAADAPLQQLLARSDVHSALHDVLPEGPPAGNIDWVFHRGMRTVRAELVENVASDHPVVRAELDLAGGDEDRE